MNNFKFQVCARLRISLFVACGLVLFPSTIRAHAFLDRSSPEVGAKLAKLPTEIKIWFTADINPAASGIELSDGQGTQLDKKDVHGDPKDKTLLTVSVPALSAGTYIVQWHATTIADGHKTKGDFKFEIYLPIK